MGTWGAALYSSDFAADLRARIAMVARLPLDEERLLEVICSTEKSSAENPADADHTVFWLVVADQFEKRGIFSTRARDMALAIIDGGKDSAMMQNLGMRPVDLRKRAANLEALRARLAAQPHVSHRRKTIDTPQPYVFEIGGVYAFPLNEGKPINPYMSPKQLSRSSWSPNGFGLILVIGRGRAFDYFAWYQAVTAHEVLPSPPDTSHLVSEVRWAPPIYGTCSAAHFRKIEFKQVGLFPILQTRVDHFFPHLAPGTPYAIADISIANGMKIENREVRRRWRRPDGKLALIIYPPPPTIAELLESPAEVHSP
jgi:hypothetical protein